MEKARVPKLLRQTLETVSWWRHGKTADADSEGYSERLLSIVIGLGWGLGYMHGTRIVSLWTSDLYRHKILRRRGWPERRESFPMLTSSASVGHFPLGDIFPQTFPPDNFPPHLRHSPAVKAKIWKLALTHTPGSNRPTTQDSGPNPNPNRPTGPEIFWKVTLTCIPDPNRSTAISFVDVNGRSLYVVDWQMMVVVERGDVLHHVTGRGNCSGWGMSGLEYVNGEWIRTGGNVRIPRRRRNVFGPMYR